VQVKYVNMKVPLMWGTTESGDRAPHIIDLRTK
jgi:hypothetical protein